MKKRKIGLEIGMIVFCALLWLPILVMVGNSLMGEEEINVCYGAIFKTAGSSGQFLHLRLLPQYPTLAALVKLLLDSPDFFVMFWNTAGQSVGTVLGQLVVAMPAAWAFARYEFRGRKVLFFVYVLLMILPFQVTMVSDYLVLSKLNLIDTVWAIILPGTFSTFPVFLLYKFFKEIPQALLEAAKVDGAGAFSCFWYIGIPVGMPGIFACLILNLLENWNAIERPMTFLKTKAKLPLSLYFSQMTESQMASMFTASFVMMLPPILLYLWGQEYLEQGIAACGIKE